jgi:hypothetical protein
LSQRRSRRHELEWALFGAASCISVEEDALPDGIRTATVRMTRVTLVDDADDGSGARFVNDAAWARR